MELHPQRLVQEDDPSFGAEPPDVLERIPPDDGIVVASVFRFLVDVDWIHPPREALECRSLDIDLVVRPSPPVPAPVRRVDHHP